MQGQKEENHNSNKEVRNVFIRFYLENTYWLVKSFDRPFWLSLMLVAWKQAQYFLMMLSPEIADRIQKKSRNVDYLSQIVFFQDNDTIKYTFLIIFLVYNSIILVYFLIHLGIFLQTRQLARKDPYISFLFQTYYFAIFILSSLASILQFKEQSALSILNLIFTFIIGSNFESFLAFKNRFFNYRGNTSGIQALHEYDQRFKKRDYLSVRQSWQRTISLILEIISLILYSFLSYNSLLVASMIFYGVLFAIDFKELSFYDRNIQILNTAGYIFNFFSCANTLFLLNDSQWYPFNVPELIFFPLSYQLSKVLINFRVGYILRIFMTPSRFGKNKLIYDHIDESASSLQSLDLYLRALYSDTTIEYADYLSSPTSVVLEGIIQSHKMNCQQYPFCFCAQELTLEELGQNESRIFYLNDYIERSYQIQAEKIRSNASFITFSFLMYVIDVSGNETKTLTLALKLYNNLDNKMSLIERQKLHQVIRFINSQVKLQAKQNKSLGKKANQPKMNFIENINFDTKLLESSVLLGQCLDLKPAALSRIGQNHVDLQEVFIIFSQLRQLREQLEDQFKELINLCHESILLAYMIELFEKSLTFDAAVSKLLRRTKKLSFTVRTNGSQNTKLNGYSEDSCVVFITLLSAIGTVVKTSKNLKDIVPIYSSEEAIGKNITFMQPPGIARFHDKIVLDFISKKQVSDHISSYPLLIGIDKQGWAIPYHIQLQTCLIGTEDFGVCAWIKQIVDSSLYIAVNQINNFEVFAVSKLLFDVLLEESIEKKSLTSVCLSSLMPSLSGFISKGWSPMNPTYETVIFKPYSEEFCFSEINYEERSSLVAELFEVEMYKIKASILPFNNKFVNFLQIRVEKLIKLEDFSSKFEAMRNLLTDMEQFNQYHKDFVLEQIQILMDKKTKVAEQELLYQNTQGHSISNKDEGLQTIPSNKSVSEKSLSGHNQTQNNPSNSMMEKIIEKQIKEIEGGYEDVQVNFLHSLPRVMNSEQQIIHGNDSSSHNLNYLTGYHSKPSNFESTTFHTGKNIQSMQKVTSTKDTAQQQSNTNINNTTMINTNNMNNISGIVNTVNNNLNISGIASPNANVNASRFGSNYNNTMNNFLSYNNNNNSIGFNNLNQFNVNNTNTTGYYNDKQNYKDLLEISQSKQNLKGNNPNQSKFQEIAQESFYEIPLQNRHDQYVEKVSEQYLLPGEQPQQQQIINSDNEFKKFDTQFLLSQVYSEKLMSSPMRAIDIDYYDNALSSPKPLITNPQDKFNNNDNNYPSGNLNQYDKNSSNQRQKANSKVSKNTFIQKKTGQSSSSKASKTLTLKGTLQNVNSLGNTNQQQSNQQINSLSADQALKRFMPSNLNEDQHNNKSFVMNDLVLKVSTKTQSNQFMQDLTDLSPPQLAPSIKKHTLVDDSIESSKAISSSFRSMVHQVLRQTKFVQLKLMKYMGLACLSGVIALYLYQYITINQQLVDQRNDYPNVDWSSQVRLISSLIVNEQIINILTTEFPEFALSDSTLQAAFIKQILHLQSYRYAKFKSYLKTYYRTTQTTATLFQSIVFDQSMSFKFAFTPTRYETAALPFSYVESAIFGYSYSLSFNLYDRDGESELQVLSNFQNTWDLLTKIDNLVFSGLHDMYTSMRDNALVSLLIGLVVSFVASMSLLPLYFYIQKKRQDILILLTTFSPDKLQGLVDDAIQTKQMVEYEIWRKFNVQLHQLGASLSLKRQTLITQTRSKASLVIQKKKNISTTTSLSGFKCSILFLATMFLLQSVIYSFSSFIGLSLFFDIQEYNREFINEVNIIHQLLNRVIGVRSQLLRFKLEGNEAFFNTYKSRAFQLQAQLPAELANYYEITTKQSGISRYMKQQFLDVVQPILEGDACYTVTLYPEYQVTGDFDYNECISLKDNLFKHGLINVSKFYFLFLDQIMIGLTSDDAALVRQNGLALQNVFSLHDAFLLKIYYTFIMDTIRSLIKDITKQHYDYFINIIMLIFLFQILCFLTATYFIYLKVYRDCFKSISDTKRLIDLIDIEILAENQYVISYFNSQK